MAKESGMTTGRLDPRDRYNHPIQLKARALHALLVEVNRILEGSSNRALFFPDDLRARIKKETDHADGI